MRALLCFTVCALSACGASPATPAISPGQVDADADSVPGPRDRCPRDAEDLDGFEDNDGCPDPDNDADGIADVDDLCPNDWEDCDGFEDADGCPDPDNDRDRIDDLCDACPNAPETYNGVDDEDGCPDRASVATIFECRLTIQDRIHFAQDSTNVRVQSIPVIDALATTILGNPQLVSIAVVGAAEGHERNASRLGFARAVAVRDLLVTRGVAPERLETYASSDTLPSFARAHDREAARYVSLWILRDDQGELSRWDGRQMEPLTPPPRPPNSGAHTEHARPVPASCAANPHPAIARPPPGGCGHG